MGNDNHSGGTGYELKKFEMQKYMNQGLNQVQILQVKEAFESYEPVDGQIQLSKLKLCTEQSTRKDKIDKYMLNKESMNFNEFFAMSKDLISQQIKSNPDLILDTQEVQATCLFCPYAEDVKRG